MINKATLYYLWIVSLALIVLCYCWLDRDISTFIFEHHWREYLSQIPGLKSLVEWPSKMAQITPILFFMLLLFKKNTMNKEAKWQSMLLSLCLSVFLVYLLKNDLQWVFSRCWPETWINQNPSWIHDHAYGFQWFQGKAFVGTDMAGSFPSGHSSVAFATFVSIGLFYRKVFTLCVLLATLEALSMTAFDYHFLSDIIAGACLGITCAVLCYSLFYFKENVPVNVA